MDDTETDASIDTDEQIDAPVKFNAILDKSLLDSFISTIQPVAKEVRMSVSEDGFRVVALDAANVSGVDATLSADGFESLNIAKEGQVGVKVGVLDDVLSKVDADLVELSFDESYKLRIKGGSVDYKAGVITLSALDDDSFNVDYSDRPSAAIVQTAGDIRSAIMTAELAHDKMTFAYNDSRSTFEIRARGDTDRSVVEYDEDDFLDAHADGSVESLYEVGYVKRNLKPTDKDTELSLRFGSDYPLTWRYTLDEHVNVLSLMAPRVLPE